MYRVMSLALMGLLWLTSPGTSKETDSDSAGAPKDPATAPRASIDRFSERAGKLFVRDGSNGLPAADAPIDFDREAFVTQGFGPNGEVVRYYNFDVQPVTPAPIYVLFREGENQPVEGQLNITDVIPGDTGYNDFWRVMRVTVPANYEANTITSLAEIRQAGYLITPTSKLVNCPIVPAGSTARLRAGGESAELHQGWYRGMVVYYFTFEEKDLATTRAGQVPLSPIYVTFNINPDEPGGGPPSGFVAEKGSAQTHNVVQALPASPAYSPLWSVSVYDNADFADVRDLRTVAMARILATGVATVNCPIVAVVG